MTPRDQLNPTFLKEVERVERRDRVRYGAGVLRGEVVFVDVRFYPEFTWRIHQNGRHRNVSVEEARQVQEIAL